MRIRFVAAGLVFVGVVGLTGCSSSSSSGDTTSTPSTSPTHELTGTAWVLTSYQGSAGETVNAFAGATAALTFTARGALSGSTGCNQFSGTYVASGTSLTIKTGAMTLIGCTNGAQSAQESALLQLLPQVATFTIAADTLALKGSNGTTLLTYAAGLTGVAGTSWKATGVNNGHGGVESAAGTERLTATFGSDGTFTGFGGCNSISGTYQVSGSEGLTLSGLTSTQMSCAADVNELESQYIAALGRVSTYGIAGDQLTLRNGAGETQVTYRLAG
jgi:heat shock protein HslJ